MSVLTSLVLVVVGLVLAFAGRRYVWLLIGASAFLLVFWVLSLLQMGDSLTALLISLAAGIVAAFLLRVATRLVLWIAGFVLVATAAGVLGERMGMEPWSTAWILTFLGGGVVGLVLGTLAHTVGIVIVTALGGAAMVMIGLPDLGLPLAPQVQDLIAPVLAVAGFIVQFVGWGR